MESTETVPIIKTVSFREVHEELEKESTFLNQNHDVSTFKEKGDFLSTIGFKNSIAAKLYVGIAENVDVVEEYRKRYHEMYKFILKPQLERVCEKYNLYVRSLDMFIADIPEKNIKDMMNFHFYLSDLPDVVIFSLLRFRHFEERIEVYEGAFMPPTFNMLKKGRIITALGSKATLFVPELKYSLFEFFDEMEKAWKEGGFSQTRVSKTISHYYGNDKERIANILHIAAIPGMFSPIAFEKSTARIIEEEHMEAIAKNTVDLDPIVLLRTQHGYLIITAWGDEANDELIANQKFN